MRQAWEIARISRRDPMDEINTMTMAEIESRLVEYAEEHKWSAPFYGSIDLERRKIIEASGYSIRVFDDIQPITEISWNV